jgi:hypothetical protein
MLSSEEILRPDDSRSRVSRGEGKGIANVGSEVSGRQRFDE